MLIAVLGIDLGKNSCSVVGLDEVVVRRRMRRDGMIAFAAKLGPCTVAMEACCGAHHMGRSLAKPGHTVRLMSPEYVRPYVKAQKNDDRDAEAIAEAATQPTMRFVELKSEAQLHLQTLHRVRDRLVGDRMSLMNQMRSLLLERGHVVPQGRAKLKVFMAELLTGDDGGVSPPMRELLSDMLERWEALNQRITAFDSELVATARDDPRTLRLLTIPGIGALNATALVAPVGDARTFDRGRDLAAWLGLVPRQATTSVKPRLLGITKHGSRYLPKNLIQSARAALPALLRAQTRLGTWLRGLDARAHRHAVVVALAAKLARIAWALLRHERSYAAQAPPA